ncbi:MAG: hypothetical protein WBV79_14350, partial [Rhodomicrobium sp.]
GMGGQHQRPCCVGERNGKREKAVPPLLAIFMQRQERRQDGRKKKLDPSKERLEAHGGRRRPCPGRDACLPLNFDGKIVLFPPKDNGEAAAQAAKKRRSKPGLTARPPGRAVIRLKTPHQPEGDFGGQ